MATTEQAPTVGELLRDWRVRRRQSQLSLALDAEISTRHLSFVETGRSRPSASLVVHLAECLDVPLRERNRMLLAAGFAPAYGQHELDAPELDAVRDVIDRLLRGHEPYPALVVDGHWGLVAANAAVTLLMEGVAAHLLEPPVNVLRLALHPDGLAPRTVNLVQWRTHLLDRLARQAATTGDPALATLHAELTELPGSHDDEPAGDRAPAIAVPYRLRRPDGTELSFLSTVTTFGTATDITVAELAIEAFLPADRATADAMRAAVP
jgi:transcriptional regulator with XRE-family HTH domain